MTLNALIEKLTALRENLGGDTTVLITDPESFGYNGEFIVEKFVAGSGEVFVDINLAGTREL